MWEVINAFFEEKGLVMQQLDSFNHFIDFQIQEVVDEQAEVLLKTNPQFDPSVEDQQMVCHSPTCKEVSTLSPYQRGIPDA